WATTFRLRHEADQPVTQPRFARLLFGYPPEGAAVQPGREGVRQFPRLAQSCNHRDEFHPCRPALFNDDLRHARRGEQPDGELREPARGREVAIYLWRMGNSLRARKSRFQHQRAQASRVASVPALVCDGALEQAWSESE